jgi:hypothetical protein
MSCNQNSSQPEKDYIKILEEKNKALEKELQELKNNSKPNHIHQEEAKKSKDYFTIGSTEDKVIEVMGDPTSYMITAPEAKKFHYGISTIYFYRGKVLSYDNLEGNLKVKVK